MKNNFTNTNITNFPFGLSISASNPRVFFSTVHSNMSITV